MVGGSAALLGRLAGPVSGDELDEEDADGLEEDSPCCGRLASGESSSAPNLTLSLELAGAVKLRLLGVVWPRPLSGLIGCRTEARFDELVDASASSSSSSSRSRTGEPGGKNASKVPDLDEGGGPKPNGFEYDPLRLCFHGDIEVPSWPRLDGWAIMLAGKEVDRTHGLVPRKPSPGDVRGPLADGEPGGVLYGSPRTVAVLRIGALRSRWNI